MLKEKSIEFANSAIDCLYDLDAIDVSKDVAILSVKSEIEDLLKLNDEKTLKKRFDYFSILGTKPEDFKESFYELGHGKKVLAGIRHKSGLKDQPFVHTVLDFVPTSTEIGLLSEFAAKQFHKFKPKHLSIWMRPSLKIDLSKYEVKQSRQYVVGSVAKIRNMVKPVGYEKIALERVTTDFDYNWYSEAYAEFHQQRPDLKDWVPITDREDIDRCISDQLLFKVFVDDLHAGLIGGQNESLLGMSSVYMTELLLISKFKGQGLAVALQRKFIDEVPKSVDLVWGTIDAKNLPSLKTALRVGRLPIRSEYFIKLS